MKQTVFPIFAVLALFSASVSAEPEEGWFEEAPSDATAPETTETEAGEDAAAEAPEAKKPSDAPKAKPAEAPATAATSEDPVRDQAIEKKERNPSARRHDGFYLRMSLGGGSLAARGDRWDDTYTTRRDYTFEGNALAGDILVGGTPFPGFALGGAYIGTMAGRANYEETESEDVAMSFGMVGPFIDIFPDPHGGFHLGGMLGPAATVAYDDRDEERSAAVGFGGSLWVGYDFWISDQWSLGGVLRASAARVETPASRELDQFERDRLGVGSVALMITALYH